MIAVAAMVSLESSRTVLPSTSLMRCLAWSRFLAWSFLALPEVSRTVSDSLLLIGVVSMYTGELVTGEIVGCRLRRGPPSSSRSSRTS